MADTTQDVLLETFNEAAAGLTESVESLSTEAISGDSSQADLAPQTDTAPKGSPSGQDNESGNGPSIVGDSSSPDGSGSPSASTNSNSGGGTGEALSIATTVLESGLGIVPLVAGLIGLFSGGDSNTPAPLTKYAMPDKVQYEGADTGDGMSDSDFDQMGMPRDYSGTPDGAPTSSVAPTTTNSAAGSAGGSGNGSGGNTAATPQIQVTVQAMDAQSFLDHSSDIAQAVRSAMLNLSSLNDVVSDL
jgi:hypothetical protein